MFRQTLMTLVLVSGYSIAADDPSRTITVSGQGTVQTAPDRATVIMSIMARAQTVSAAQQEAAEVAARVLKLAEELEIPENRVDTMSASVFPDYRWNQQREEQEIRGYVANREMRFEIHDLEKVGQVIERAVGEGVNQVSPPQLSSSKHREAYRDALAQAVDDARANAERLAASLGVSLGSAIQVSAGQSAGPRFPMAARFNAGMALEAAQETYSAGDLSIVANVSVVFDLVE